MRLSRGAAFGWAAAGVVTLGCGGEVTSPSQVESPSQVTTRELASGSIEISWQDNSDNETAFELSRSATGPSGSYAVVATVDPNVSTFQDTTVDGVSQYCYRVRALGSGATNASAFSSPSCVQPVPPVAPSQLAASASFGQVDLTWTDNSDTEVSFEVWRSVTGESGTFTLEASVAADGVAYSNTGLQDGVEYCYRVRAVGPKGLASEFSSTACATPPVPTSPPPAAPSNLALAVQSGASIALTWQDNAADEAGFEVWRSTTGTNGTYTKRADRPANSESYTDSELSAGTEYCYKVLAAGTNGAPNSTFTDPRCATTLSPPATPSNLTATARSSSRIDLTWQDNAMDEGGYELWRSTTGEAGSYSKRSTLAANAGSTSDTGLSPGTEYCYKVLAAGTNGAPDSPFTTPACATTNAAVVIRITLFGDSNTDRCEEDTSLPGSYVSIAPRLRPNAAHLSCMVAGKVQATWRSQRSETITVVNHGIGGTTTGGLGGAGDPTRSANGAPNARLAVNGITRFEAEVLGTGAPNWKGGEPNNGNFSGPITRVNAYVPDDHDFAYVSMGTNDDAGAARTLTAAQTEANLRWMVQQWIDAGHRASHFILTTLPPRDDANSSTSIPDRNTRVRDIANDTGVHLIDISNHVSDDNGATWRNPSDNIGDGIHYTAAVRQWIADQVVSWMSSETPP
ncbi:MAG TPA: fibronectin type III domain-containing protein [Gemmatimonadales bacterium]|jgi:lysophospholipase L1-like esterase